MHARIRRNSGTMFRYEIGTSFIATPSAERRVPDAGHPVGCVFSLCAYTPAYTLLWQEAYTLLGHST